MTVDPTVKHERVVQLHDDDGFFWHENTRLDPVVGSLVALSDGTVEFRPFPSGVPT